MDRQSFQGPDPSARRCLAIYARRREFLNRPVSLKIPKRQASSIRWHLGRGWLCLATFGALTTGVSAGDAEILFAEFEPRGDNRWAIAVTLRHADTGWDHYANAWRVVADDGEIYGERVLHHPHVNEQPFTRRLDAVRLPPDTRTVFIEAQDSVHGANPQRLRIDLDSAESPRHRIRSAP